MRNSITAQRRYQIAQMLLANGSIKVSETAQAFGVSMETIRKDLLYLDEMGIAKKSHGGALTTGAFNGRDVDFRDTPNINEKNDIAEKALEFIPENAVVVLDVGSTMYYLAKRLRIKKGLTIITNSIPIAEVLSDSENNVYLAGGQIKGKYYAVYGMWTVEAFSTVKSHIAFMGTDGFLSHNGPATEAFMESVVKKSIIANSKTKIVLADSSKFDRTALVRFAEWNEIDILITDKKAPPARVEEIKTQTRVILV